MSKSTNWLDGAAVGLSALCLVHCLALPVLVAGLPFLAQFSAGHLHAQMLVVVLPLSIVALGLGFRHHRSIRIVVAGVIGMSILTLGATVAHARLGLTADRLFTIVGALILAAAHFYNSIRTRERRDCS
ncbi:MAG: MerC domain-containing protein [Gammaproteobacteria bacterium]|nr:MerC domain-containing protein [Gammaproteobacteria bacterium]MDH3433764.1 MerC domain-containing protein [Gammaproteobacteria bacterium]